MTPYLRGQCSIMAPPVVHNDRLIVCGLDGGLYVLDLESGRSVVSHQLGDPIAASPCSVDGDVCVGTWDRVPARALDIELKEPGVDPSTGERQNR